MGRGIRIVKQGECISSIAEDTGHLWQTIWNEPSNSKIKESRGNPDVLFPGDHIFIPPIRNRLESVTTGSQHKFRRKGLLCNLNIQVCEDGDPKANKNFRLIIDGETISGKTDGEGRIQAMIPSKAKKAQLLIVDEEETEYEIQLGTLDPYNTVRGVQQRLGNLGFYKGRIDGSIDATTIAAFQLFQLEQGIDITDDIDEQTCVKLRDVHGS